MGIFSRYLKQGLWDHIFDTTKPSLPRPTSLKIHLHTADPGDLGTIGEVDILLWTNYAPVVVNNDGLSALRFETPWLDVEDWVTDNFGAVDFGTVVMDDPLTTMTITYMSIRDQLDNCWLKGQLATHKLISHGSTVKFVNGALDARIT